MRYAFFNTEAQNTQSFTEKIKISFTQKRPEESGLVSTPGESHYALILPYCTAACAAASLAIGTRNGEQLT